MEHTGLQAFKALHAPFDAAAIVSACDHFLTGVAALGEGDRIDAVEVEHLRHELRRSGRVNLRLAGGNIECAPLLARHSGRRGFGRLRICDQHRAIISQRPALRWS